MAAPYEKTDNIITGDYVVSLVKNYEERLDERNKSETAKSYEREQELKLLLNREHEARVKAEDKLASLEMCDLNSSFYSNQVKVEEKHELECINRLSDAYRSSIDIDKKVD